MIATPEDEFGMIFGCKNSDEPDQKMQKIFTVQRRLPDSNIKIKLRNSGS